MLHCFISVEEHHMLEKTMTKTKWYQSHKIKATSTLFAILLFPSFSCFSSFFFLVPLPLFSSISYVLHCFMLSILFWWYSRLLTKTMLYHGMSNPLKESHKMKILRETNSIKNRSFFGRRQHIGTYNRTIPLFSSVYIWFPIHRIIGPFRCQAENVSSNNLFSGISICTIWTDSKVIKTRGEKIATILKLFYKMSKLELEFIELSSFISLPKMTVYKVKDNFWWI